MAKTSGNPFEQKLNDIDARIADHEEAVAKAQAAYRKDPLNADLRAAVHAAKQPLMALSVERGFYARAISELAGGQSHMPPA